ncbi:CheR family methyltransferase [Paraburkholderia acidipaludis]|uniref:CheR family methyltransferase n=1 Tax=Paraburkholderia acidipaludis TaxID=660537 RepID=UPI0005B7825A|nr:CheR family methyltransferase [Paraburkholderia acidipaludis]
MSAGDPRFAGWLLQETGIDAPSLGVNALARAVALRAAATVAAEVGEASQAGAMPAAWEAGVAVPGAVLDAYWVYLTSVAAERQALIDALVVPETWFFREREAFTALARLGAERLARRPGDVLRVLSAPCSSGEEPYSAAMALLDAGFAADQLGIDAIDISAASIAAAERGVYGRNAFRGDGLAFREHHFEPVEDGWRIGMHVRRPVTFERANLFEWLAAHPVRYDFIFCRNVLIYFDRDAQDRAIRLLRERLSVDGMIFVGPAETGLMMRHEMVSAYIPLAFGFRLPDEREVQQRAFAPGLAPAPLSLPLRPMLAAAPKTALAAAPVPALSPIVASASMLQGSGAPRTTTPAAPARSLRPQLSASAASPFAKPLLPAAAPGTELLEARRLADAGELDAARRLAWQATQSAASDADAWYLLGLIADAQGHTAEARDHYRKAVYLDPAHYEALTHLAALLEVEGDGDGARRLMRRAERAAPGSPRQGGADV